MSATETRELQITVGELREASLNIADALRGNAYLIAMDQDKLPLAQAYMLGMVMRTAGLTPSSLLPLIDFIKLGYEDSERMKTSPCEGHA